jgi:hypothetical protein
MNQITEAEALAKATPFHLFKWAAMHSQLFSRCQVILPISVHFHTLNGAIQFTIRLRSPEIYVPWIVKDAYMQSLGYW